MDATDKKGWTALQYALNYDLPEVWRESWPDWDVVGWDRRVEIWLLATVEMGWDHGWVEVVLCVR